LNQIGIALERAEERKKQSTVGVVYSTSNLALTASLLFLVPTLALGNVARICGYGVGAAACVANAGALVIELSSISKVSGILSELKEKQRDLMKKKSEIIKELELSERLFSELKKKQGRT